MSYDDKKAINFTAGALNSCETYSVGHGELTLLEGRMPLHVSAAAAASHEDSLYIIGGLEHGRKDAKLNTVLRCAAREGAPA